MELRVFTEPQQGATYDDLLAVARTAEQFGYGAFFRPTTTSAWAPAGAGTDRRLGDPRRAGPRHLDDPARHPDDLGDLPAPRRARDQRGRRRPDERRSRRAGSRRRLVRGGARGVRHPLPRHPRALRTARGGAGGRHRAVGHAGGRQLRLRGPALPAHRLAGAAQAGAVAAPAGAGRRQGPAAHPGPAARFADEFNIPFESVGFTTKQFGRVRDACAEAGRDPGSLVYSNASCCAAAATRPRSAAGRTPSVATWTSLRAHGLAGTPAEVVDRLGHYADAGAGRAYLQMLDLQDLDHLELVAAEVMPQARGL